MIPVSVACAQKLLPSFCEHVLVARVARNTIFKHVSTSKQAFSYCMSSEIVGDRGCMHRDLPYGYSMMSRCTGIP